MNARLSSLLLAGTAASAIAFGAGSAFAADFTGVCPNVSGHAAVGPGGTGSATGCTIGIAINSSSLVIGTGTKLNGQTGLVTNTTGTGDALAYESNEDVLIGVKNTGTGTLGGFTLTGSNLFGFDGDGIDGYAGIAANAQDKSCTTQGPGPSCYGGPDVFFTNITASKNSGVINFITALGPGQTTYFSLEEPTSGGICSTATQCPHFSAPEPASLALLAGGLLGFAGLRRLRRRRPG